METDVAIVGGGIAGLYAAWRLAGAGGRRIKLFEASGRLGGRIHTLHPAPGLTVELGAQSIRNDHPLLIRLLRDLGIATSAEQDDGGGLVHLRGRTRSQAEIRKARLRRPFAYDVPVGLQRGGPGRLLREALRRAAKIDALAVELGPRLSQLMSDEEMAYLSDRSGYGFWASPANADAVLDWAEHSLFKGAHQLFEVPSGMSSVTDALSTDARDKGVEFATGCPLLDLAVDPGGSVTLGFGPRRPPVRAASVILALPKAAIAGIGGFNQINTVRLLLAAVDAWPVVTSAVLYPDCWWTPAGFRTAIAVTDLPLGMVRHFGAEDWRQHRGVGALAMFADGARGAFWRGRSLPDGAWLAPDHPAMAEIQRMVEAIYRPKLRHAVPVPVQAMIRDWAAAPFGGAFHLWAARSKPDEARALALRPVADAPVHICGEAWSPRQAWIEGALETTESVLHRYFRMPGLLQRNG
ncbi:MAG: FAD-dependent oxidoreductase [Mesorhizobium sp.]|uniref:flavin monoamine oxidase family protein n=1 Tax=Mesorhizobium sp. TaxID=1871066 RepID=UPI001AC3324C|nr:FAD-dependent oxidoreductase [Mesorhizobium sp.]MBN9220400.1 FAD-dependent oxidoreductase [Mesorhizobium sp.]